MKLITPIRRRPSSFTEHDVVAALNKIHPYVQKLVDRFGQAQANHILEFVAGELCPDGLREEPPIYLLWKGEYAS
jgi:hypothetical protein